MRIGISKPGLKDAVSHSRGVQVRQPISTRDRGSACNLMVLFEVRFRTRETAVCNSSVRETSSGRETAMSLPGVQTRESYTDPKGTPYLPRARQPSNSQFRRPVGDGTRGIDRFDLDGIPCKRSIRPCRRRGSVMSGCIL